MGEIDAVFSAASQRKTQGGANLLHARYAQIADAASESRLRYRHRIVQIGGALALHAVIDIKDHFGRHATHGRRDRRNGYGGQMANRAGTRQDQDRPLFVRRWKSAQADVASAQGRGHDAASSQMRNSSSR